MLSGERTGYAYTDNLSPERLLHAARTAALIASGPAKQPVQGFAEAPAANLYPVPLGGYDLDLAARLELVLRADRAARIRRNAAAFGVPGLEIVEGVAPEALEGMPAPDAVFIGGGAGTSGLLDAATRALRPTGRLVVNAVTLNTESLLLMRHAALGGKLTRIAISRADPLGDKTGWHAAMPVTQWAWTKP